MAGSAFFERTSYVYKESGTRASDPAFTGETIHMQNRVGAMFTIDISADDTISATYTIQYQDPVGEDWATLLASAAQTDSGTLRLTVGPNVATTANVSVGTYCPGRIRLICTGTATSITDSVFVELFGN